jgi:hypothetical protein
MIPVGVIAASRRRTSAVNSLEYFADDVANHAFHSNVSYPASFYDSVDDKTWTFREAWDGLQRVYVAQLYNHATLRFTLPYTISTDGLVNDSHGVPAAVMDHEGYVHCFFGAHDSPLKHYVTAAPRDPTSWIALSDIGTNLTYPHPVRMGSALYLFARGGSNEELHRYKTTALSGGSATWGAVKAVVSFSGGRFYPGTALAAGTDIHIVATYSDAADTLRRDVYEFVYDTTDESAGNSDGSVSTVVGSQPISKATADTSYIVANQTTNETDVPAFCITPDGTRHLAYIDDTATPWDIAYKNYPVGGPWSSATVLTTTTGSTSAFGYKEEICLVPRADNSVELWFPDDGGAAYAVGGDMKRVVRSAAGSVGSVTTIRNAAVEGLGRPTAVLNADSTLFVMFTEVAATELDADAGGLKCFAYGRDGFVGLMFAVETRTLSDASTRTLSDATDRTILNRIV